MSTIQREPLKPEDIKREHLCVKDVCAVLRHSRADAEVQLRCSLTVGGTLVTFNLTYEQAQAVAVEMQQCLSELRRRQRAHPQILNLKSPILNPS